MNDQNKNPNGAPNEDTYDVLHRNFSLFGDLGSDFDTISEDEDVKNSGEIYFSSGAGSAKDDEFDFDRFSARRAASSRPAAAPSRNNVSRAKPAASSRTAASASGKQPKKETPAKKSMSKKSGKKKKSKKKSSVRSLVLAVVVIAFVLLASLLIRRPVIECMNDIIAINRSSIQKMVVLDKAMTTDEVIDLLAKKDLIYSPSFCKLASHLLHFDQDDPKEKKYPAGNYQLSRNMGIEGMLRTILTNGIVQSTVKLVFPEGYTVDQIVDRLVSNGVASAASLYGAMNSDEIFAAYDFLEDVPDRHLRYRALEGYLYPDTYEFYLGENPMSVIKRFLDNFAAKWEENFESIAEESDYTMDQILIISSILQKEAKNPDQMRQIASVIYNRLDSSSFPFINCDSTANYIKNREEQLIEEGSFADLMLRYDTYQKENLPVGPICNPGIDAIYSALRPTSEDYYYFMHDSDGNIHLAYTAEQHAENQRLYLDND